MKVLAPPAVWPSCRACSQRHDPMLRCELFAPAVVHSAPVVHLPVVHKVANAPSKRKPGKYADPEARKEYRRQWLAKRRKPSMTE
jgi:hypothetical protein